ncbi:hypothetical protein ACFLS1_06040 [Verrucomicrobiota bacterium]
MSLIQEALKRQQEEPEDKAPISSPTSEDQPSAEIQPDSTPPPVPEEKQAESIPPPLQQPPSVEQEAQAETMPPPPPSSTRPWPTLLGMIAVLLIVVGGGIWAVVFGIGQWKNRQQNTVGSESKQPVTSQQEPPEPQQNNLIDEPTKAPLEPEPEPVVVNDAENVQPAPEEDPVIEPIKEPPPPKPKKLPVEWPFLALSGVFDTKSGESAAILNGEIVGVGGSIEGVVVFSTGKQGATLKYKGETIFLKVGDATQ